jgi:DNA mismatch endonuclease (patch repair protein)
MERILRQTLQCGRFNNVSTNRSRTMGRIRSKGNRSTEKRFRFALVRAGISGWVLHPKGIFGTPDFYFPRHRLAIFIDGCFWHGCRRCGHIPRTRRAFWRVKFARNKERARLVRAVLSHGDISTMRFWEHEVQNEITNTLIRLRASLSGARCI